MKSRDSRRLSHRSERWRPGRSLTGVVPVLVVTALVGALLVALVPGVRQQAAASLTRETDPYVELYFTDVQEARSCPTTDGGRRAVIDARLGNRLGRAERIQWTVTLTNDTGRRAAVDDPLVRSGASARIAVSLQIPGRSEDYVVRVNLPGRRTELQIRCSADGKS